MGTPLKTNKQYVNIDRFTNQFGGIMEDLADEIAVQIAVTAKIGRQPTFRELERLRRAARVLTTATFAGGSRNGIFGEANVNPRTPYARLLNVYLANAVLDAVSIQSDHIAKVAPPDVSAFLLGARPPAYPPPRYDAPHVWVDPQGYRLSDRLWRTDQVTREKIDAMLTAELKDGKITSSYSMALKLRRFLWPKEQKVTTDKPYGKTIAFSAMRLARTEITRAFSETTFIAAEFNPWVDGMDWALSAQHPKPDICNKLATIGMHGERLRSPYDKRNAPMCVTDSHPQCVTPGQMVATIAGDKKIEDIREGDLVLTHMGRYRRVLSAWSRRIEDKVYSIKTGQGQLRITSEHPVLTQRGWVNAERLNLDDQIVYASDNTSLDLRFGITKSNPALAKRESVPASVVFGVMPVLPVALDSYFSIEGKIQIVAPDPLLFDEANVAPSKFGAHSQFDACPPLIQVHTASIAEIARGCSISKLVKRFPAILALFLNAGIGFVSQRIRDTRTHSGIVHGIVQSFKGRNFSSNAGALSGVIIPGLTSANDSRADTLRRSARAVIPNPLYFNAFATTPAVYADSVEHFHQGSVLDADPLTDNWSAEHLNTIKIVKHIYGRAAKFALNAANVLSNVIDAFTGTASRAASRSATIDTPILFGHDKFLLLSPENDGRGSGNPPVSKIATPTQAQLNYTAIEAIACDDYSGMVYNMHVDEDNSYAVNAVFLHNCICTNRPVVTANDEEVIADIRDSMRRGQPAPFTPADPIKFSTWLIGADLLNAADRFKAVLKQ